MSQRLPHSTLIAVFVFAVLPLCALADDSSDPTKQPVREIFVPFKDLSVLLQQQPQRVLMPREEYENLLKSAKLAPPEAHAPQAAMLLSADYRITTETQRAKIHGTLVVEVLEPGMHAVPLDLGGVGLLEAKLDQADASLGQIDGGRPTLLVEGVGRHKFVLDMVAPLETTAAKQVLQYRLPRPPAARMELSVPGDVELKTGAELISRTVDKAANLTRFELLPHEGDTALVMTLNSHLQQQQRAVIARSVLIDEVTEAYEKLHATVSLAILYRAVDHFRFGVPEGFEILDVGSPLLSRWDVSEEAGRKVLNVRLREQTIEPVVLSLSAIKTPSRWDDWHAAQLEPLDVVGQVAVVGLVVEDSLRAQSLSAEGLIPVDTTVLASALPASLSHPAPGTPPLRAVAAYYAPQSRFRLIAQFEKPPAKMAVTTNLLLVLDDRSQQVRGGFALMPEAEKRFGFDFTVPPSWHVASVTAADDKPLLFERYGAADKEGRIRVRLPQGIPVGQPYRVYFHATCTPPKWLSDWDKQTVECPKFAVVGAAHQDGAVAVEARDDMTVRPERLEQLLPLGENEKQQYGLAAVATTLAYRYEGPQYRASLVLQRTEPRLTAKTFSFFVVDADVLHAHYELNYRIDEARARRLQLLLPKDTPAALAIKGLDDLKLKEYFSEETDAGRRWTVLLAEPRRGTARLAIDFDQPLNTPDKTETGTSQQSAAVKSVSSGWEPVPVLSAPREGPTSRRSVTSTLPLVQAEGVQYQSGMAAVEGSAELSVDVTADDRARPVDVGELVDAEYQPGRRLLGAFGFSGTLPELKIAVAREPGYTLYPAIVERAELHTNVSPDGASQTEAQFRLRTKALYLELELPSPAAELWSVVLDRAPMKPQREGNHVLISLPATAANVSRNLQIVYAEPVGTVALVGKLRIAAPKLLLRADRDTAAKEVPLNDLFWRLHLPSGYEVTHTNGTLMTEPSQRPTLAVVEVAGVLYTLAGGTNGLLLPATQSARESGRRASEYAMHAKSAAETEAVPAVPAPSELPSAGEEKSAKQKRSSGKQRGSQEIRPGYSFVTSSDDSGILSVSSDAKVANRKDKLAETPKPTAPVQIEILEGMDVAVLKGKSEDVAEVQKKIDRLERDAAGKLRYRGLQGVRSLNISLDQSSQANGNVVAFRSLGEGPELAVELANRRGFDALGWGLAILTAVIGVALTNRGKRAISPLASGEGQGVRAAAVRARVSPRVVYVVTIAILATLIPLIFDCIAVTRVCNMVFYAVALLVPYYLLLALVRWIARLASTLAGKLRHRGGAAVATTAALLVVCLAVSATAAPPISPGGTYVIKAVEPEEPVKVPDDAVILPYDPDSMFGAEKADRLLVPYEKYVELWNRAHPDKKIETRPAPVPYATSGATYSTTLEGDEYLLVTGRLQIDLFTDDYVTLPLPLGGGVLAGAELDGKPARVATVGVGDDPSKARNANVLGPPLALYVSGKGHHTLDLAVRMRMGRQGGWRAAEGKLPTAAAVSLTIRVPQAQTEVRLSQVHDRRSYETEKAGETITTSLGSDGAMGIQWRPKVAEGQIDRSLTARSTALLDVQEDGLRLAWRLVLQFGRSQREQFTLSVPKEYLVEKVAGNNVRGWEIRTTEGKQTVEVTLLKAAKEQEDFTLQLWRGGTIGQGDLATFNVPAVTVADAALSSGEVTIRRSPLLELRTLDNSGLTRSDLGGSEVNHLAGGAESPLGIRPYQAYRFVTTPFTLRLAAAAVEAQVSANLQTIVRISEYKRSLESKITLEVQGRPIYRVELLLPEEFKLDRVTAPGDFQWALGKQDGRPLLKIFLTAAQQGQVPILLQGAFGRQGPLKEFPASVVLPRLEVRGANRQQGEIAVQVDPAFDVEAKDLSDGCDRILLGQVFSWLDPEQQKVARLALRYGRGDYTGTLRLVLRQPDVACDTVTNVRFTDRAIEETILLDFNIQNAGIRNLSFLLPPSMEHARISARMLSQKTNAGKPGEPRRITLEFQEDLMGELRVLIEDDRLIEEGGGRKAEGGQRRAEGGGQRAEGGADSPRPLGEGQGVRAEDEGGGRRAKGGEAESKGDSPIFAAGESDSQVESTAPRKLGQSPRELGPSPYTAPIPQVENCRTNRQYVTLENAGRDELIVASHAGFEPLLLRQQKEWQTLKSRLGIDISWAYVATGKDPQLALRTQPRETVKTAGARIGLAKAELVLDDNGAYRAQQLYKVDNTTEQFLEIRLPVGAALWTAQVAGEAVKPTKDPKANDERLVRIPLVKTAPGDLDYEVLLRYGGKLPPLGRLDRVEFPLVYALNIKPELSQARLYLPKSHRWFDFGGTMRPVEQEGDLLAGDVAYQTRETERLVETIRKGNEFAKVRAANNLKQLDLASQALQSSLSAQSMVAGNSSLQTELGINALRFKAAEQEVQQFEKAPAGMVLEVNGAILNEQFDKQKVSRSKNVANLMAANSYSGGTTISEGKVQAGKAQQFNDQWLAANALAATAPTVERARPESARKGAPVTLQKRGANTYSAGTTITGGTLSAGSQYVNSGNASDLVVIHNAPSDVAISSSSTLSSQGGVIQNGALIDSPVGNRNLNLETGILGGSYQLGGGSVGLTKAGAGSLMLAGDATIGNSAAKRGESGPSWGDTTILQGTLSGAGNFTASGGTLGFANGALGGNGGRAFGGGVLQYAPGNVHDLGGTKGTYTIDAQSGNARGRLGNKQGSAGTQFFGGTVLQDGGALQLGSASALPTTGSILVSGDAALGSPAGLRSEMTFAGTGTVQAGTPIIVGGNAKQEHAKSQRQQPGQAQQAGRGGRSEEKDQLARYQQRLQSQQAQAGDTVGSLGGWATFSGTHWGQAGLKGDEYKVATADAPTAPTTPGADGGQAAPARPSISGLASLELEMPDRDQRVYEVYRFTTPRGEVELSARTVSEDWLQRVTRLAAAVSAITVALLVYGMAARNAAAWTGSRRFATALVIVGLLMLLGIFPIAGLLAMAAEIVLMIKRRQPKG